MGQFVSTLPGRLPDVRVMHYNNFVWRLEAPGFRPPQPNSQGGRKVGQCMSALPAWLPGDGTIHYKLFVSRCEEHDFQPPPSAFRKGSSTSSGVQLLSEMLNRIFIVTRWARLFVCVVPPGQRFAVCPKQRQDPLRSSFPFIKSFRKGSFRSKK